MPDSASSRSPDDRPWTVRDDWAAGRITDDPSETLANSETRMLPRVGGAFALVGAGTTFLTAAWVLGVIFMVVGLGLGGIYLYRRQIADRYGTTVFEMDTVPGVRGGPLCGVLHTGVDTSDAPSDGFRVRLTCARHRTDRDSDGVHTSRAVLWTTETQMRGRPSADGATLDVPVVFEIPDDMPASTPHNASDRPRGITTRHTWTLDVSARVPGVDYAASMEVPVFTVEDDGTAPVDEYARYEFERDDDTPLSKGITLRHPSSHELEIVFGSARRPWFAVLLAAFGLPLTVVAYWMLTSFVLFGAFVVGLMAVLIDWIVLHALLHRSWVTVDQDNVCVRSSMFGEGTPTCIPCTALQKVEAKSSGPRLYSLVVHYQTEAGDDDTLQAASLLPDLVEAEWLASRIEQQAAENARYA